MGRIFETRKATMFARYDRMAKAFTKCGREIAMAVKAGGENPDFNPALRRAIQNARAANMPNDRVKSAIKKALGETGPGYETLYYEGYGPHGVAMMIETATDNNTRTVANVRMHFNKGGGNLGNTGSVAFLFNRMGVFRLKPDDLDPEELELELIDHGLEELGESEDDDGNPVLVLRCAFESFGDLQSGLDERKIEPISSGIEFIPTLPVSLDEAQAEEVLKLVERLEGDDDVQNVFHTLS